MWVLVLEVANRFFQNPHQQTELKKIFNVSSFFGKQFNTRWIFCNGQQIGTNQGVFKLCKRGFIARWFNYILDAFEKAFAKFIFGS